MLPLLLAGTCDVRTLLHCSPTDISKINTLTDMTPGERSVLHEMWYMETEAADAEYAQAAGVATSHLAQVQQIVITLRHVIDRIAQEHENRTRQIHEEYRPDLVEQLL